MYEIGTQFTTPSVERRSVFVDLIGSRSEVLSRLTALEQQLTRALANPKVLVRCPTPQPFRLADARTTADRVAELAGVAVPYEMAQLEPGYRGAETVRIALGIASYYAEKMAVSPGAITVHGVATLRFDPDGKVTDCAEVPSLRGSNVLLALAAFIEQDFGTVVLRGERLFYVCECSEFEKTPKQVAGGHNGFLGEDFIDWHVRIPHYGPVLASIFAQVSTLFARNSLDMFVVDLRGRHLYSDGARLLRRYERDYAVPLRDAAGEYLGMNVFADVLLGDVDDERHPLAGGPFRKILSPIEFHRTASVVKHPGFTEHPAGKREADGSAKRLNGSVALNAGE